MMCANPFEDCYIDINSNNAVEFDFKCIECGDVTFTTAFLHSTTLLDESE